jgi:hypothetical protein
MARPKSTNPTLTGEGRKVAAFVPLEIYRELKRQAFERAMATDTTVTVSTILRELLEQHFPSGQPSNGKGVRMKKLRNQLSSEVIEGIDGATAAHADVRAVSHGGAQVAVPEHLLHVARALSVGEEPRRDRMAKSLGAQAFGAKLQTRRADRATHEHGVEGDAGRGGAEHPAGLGRAA